MVEEDDEKDSKKEFSKKLDIALDLNTIYQFQFEANDHVQNSISTPVDEGKFIDK